MGTGSAIRALIFDFDGLILDTEGPDFQAWQEIFAEYGASLTLDVWSGVIGGSVEEGMNPYGLLEAQTGRPLDRDAVKAAHLRRIATLLDGITPFPGVEAAIEQAPALGLKLGVASSSPHEWVDPHLARLGLRDHFQVVCCRDDVPRVKPDPALFLCALAGLGVAPHEALVFEDSPNGVTAANAAGIFTVAVPNDITRQLPLDHADLRLASLADLPLPDLLRLVDGR